MQIVYLAAPKIVGGQDHVAERWGELPGEPAVRVPAGLQAEVKTVASRSRAVLPGVVENDPASIARFLSELGRRDAARIEAIGGRRLSFIAAGQDAGDLAIDEGLASAIVVAWHRPDEDALDDLREALEMEKIPELEKIVAWVKTLGESVRAGMEAGEGLDDSIVEAKVADGFSSRDTPIGSRWQPNGGLDEGSDFGAADETDDAGDSAASARQALDAWRETGSTRGLVDALGGSDATRRRAVELAATRAYGNEFLGLPDADGDVAFLESLVAKTKPEPKAKAPLLPQPLHIADPDKLPPRKFLFNADYIRKYVSLTTSPGGRGKSSLLLAEAFGMAAGRDLSGKPTKPLRVLHWCLEDPLDELHLRVGALLKYHRMRSEDLGARLYVLSGREHPLKIAYPKDGRPTVDRAAVERLVANLLALRIDVLQIDPFVSLHLCGENDTAAMDLVIKELGRVADACNCAVHVANHARKPLRDGDGRITSMDSRGASALIDGVRAQRLLNPMTDKEATQFGIEPEAAWRYIKLEDGKGNLRPKSAGRWLKLEFRASTTRPTTPRRATCRSSSPGARRTAPAEERMRRNASPLG